MANRVIFRFDGIPAAVGLQEIVISRPLNAREIKAGVGQLRGDLEFFVDGSLLNNLADLSFEGSKDPVTLGSIAGEVSFTLTDTFDSTRIRAKNPVEIQAIGLYGRVVGGKYVSTPLSFDSNFGLVKLILCSDIDQYIKDRYVIPEKDIRIDYIIDGVKRNDYWWNPAGNSEGALYTDGDDVEGEYLTNENRFFDYKTVLSDVKVLGYDYAKFLLEKWKIGDVRLPAATQCDLWGCGADGGDTTVYWGEAAWTGHGIREFLTAMFNRIFMPDEEYDKIPDDDVRLGICQSKYWGYYSEKSPFGFLCATIPNGTGTQNDAFLNLGAAYAPYLKIRMYDDIGSGSTKITGYFNPLSPTEKDAGGLTIDADEIWLHESFTRELSFIPTSTSGFENIRQNDKEYCFARYDSLFEVASRVLGSFGLGLRLRHKDGKPNVQILQKTRTPHLVKIPAHIEEGLNIEPFGNDYKAVSCEPYGSFGEQCTHRLIKLGGTYDNHPINTTPEWSKYAKLIEPFNDKTRVNIKWRGEDWDYFHWEDIDIESNEPRENPVIFPYTHIERPTAFSSVPVDDDKVFKTNVFYGLFGNLCVCVFGCAFDDDVPDHGGIFEGGIQDVFEAGYEFVWIPIGSNLEYMLPRESGNRGSDERAEGERDKVFASGYPGLILYAGRSSDNGKTVDASATSGQKVYRGAICMNVPVADPSESYHTSVICYSAMAGMATFMGQFMIGNGGRVKIKLPTLHIYENDLGETGFDALYEGLGIKIFGMTYEITSVKKQPNEDVCDIEALLIPPAKVLPEPEDFKLRRVISVNPTYLWQYYPSGPRYFWTGSGGGAVEERHNLSHNGA